MTKKGVLVILKWSLPVGGIESVPGNPAGHTRATTNTNELLSHTNYPANIDVEYAEAGHGVVASPHGGEEESFHGCSDWSSEDLPPFPTIQALAESIVLDGLTRSVVPADWLSNS